MPRKARKDGKDGKFFIFLEKNREISHFSVNFSPFLAFLGVFLLFYAQENRLRDSIMSFSTIPRE